MIQLDFYIGILFCIVCLITFGMYWVHSLSNIKNIICIVGMIASLVLCLILYQIGEKETQKQMLARISDGYVVYIDGIETDPDDIDISMYKVHVDDEKHQIYLTAN